MGNASFLPRAMPAPSAWLSVRIAPTDRSTKTPDDVNAIDTEASGTEVIIDLVHAP